MKFIREIPANMITDNQLVNLQQFGFTLIWTKDSVEVWAQVVAF